LVCRAWTAFVKTPFRYSESTRILTDVWGTQPSFQTLCSIAPYFDDERLSFLVADRSRLRIDRLSLTPLLDRIQYIGPRIELPVVCPLECFTVSKPPLVDKKELAGGFGPRAVCMDPSRKNHYFVAYDTDVRVGNGAWLAALAGRAVPGCSDGHRSDASFGHITASVCASDGKTLFVADLANHCIRRIQTRTGLVGTVVTHWKDDPTSACKIGTPRKLAFYRSTTVKPDSVLFITTDELGILRLDIETDTVSRILGAKTDENCFCPWAIACAASGTLIFNCNLTDGLYAVDPTTEVVEFLGGVPDNDYNFGDVLDESECTSRAIVSDLCVDDEDQSVWLLQNASFRTDGSAFDRARVSRIAVPPELFWVSCV
jgi:hypothetical protein